MSERKAEGHTQRSLRRHSLEDGDSIAREGGAPSRARRGRVGRVVDQVAANPLAAVFGAAAVSAGVALLLPSSVRETELMGEVADKLGDIARDAADSVVAAGRAEVETLAQSALAGVGGAVIQAVASNVTAGEGQK